jgi:hypothetical protein
MRKSPKVLKFLSLLIFIIIKVLKFTLCFAFKNFFFTLRFLINPVINEFNLPMKFT